MIRAQIDNVIAEIAENCKKSRTSRSIFDAVCMMIFMSAKDIVQSNHSTPKQSAEINNLRKDQNDLNTKRKNKCETSN